MAAKAGDLLARAERLDRVVFGKSRRRHDDRSRQRGEADPFDHPDEGWLAAEGEEDLARKPARAGPGLDHREDSVHGRHALIRSGALSASSRTLSQTPAMTRADVPPFWIGRSWRSWPTSK